MPVTWTSSYRGWIITASTGLLSVAVLTLYVNVFNSRFYARSKRVSASSYLTTVASRKPTFKYEYAFVRNTRHDGTDPISCLSGPWNECVGKPRRK
jgi:hypothetical protein